MWMVACGFVGILKKLLIAEFAEKSLTTEATEAHRENLRHGFA
jgi:hypothetical protein